MAAEMTGHRADIAIVISGLQRGGAERVASSLANMWSRAGQRVTLITFLPADDDAFSLDGGVERTVAAIPGWPGILRNRISGNLLRIVAQPLTADEGLSHETLEDHRSARKRRHLIASARRHRTQSAITKR